MQKWPRVVNLQTGMLSGLSPASSLRRVLRSWGRHPFQRVSKETPRERQRPLLRRHQMVLGDNGRLAAQIQGLPGPAAVLNGKPALKR
jgi:hypothetical protein